MPIKGLTESRRMPRVGKIHLGIKVKNKQNVEYPKATDYFVYPTEDSPGGELLEQLIESYGEKPKELPVIFPLEDEEAIASQYYRCYSRPRGLICRGDGETCTRMIDKQTGDLPNKDTKDTALQEMACAGRECPDYQGGQCREVMNLQFMLPQISGIGVWQIDTSSINSIRNINSCLEMIRVAYGRIAMVPLTLTLEPIDVTPPGGTKKTVQVLNLRSMDNMIEAAIKARKSPMELIAGPPDTEQAERDIAENWPQAELDRKLTDEEAASRMSPEEIAKASEEAVTEEETRVIGTSPEPAVISEPEPIFGEEGLPFEPDEPLFEPEEPKRPKPIAGLKGMKEALATLKKQKPKAWSDENVIAYIKKSYFVEGKTVNELLSKLDDVKKNHFINQIKMALDK